MRELGEYLKQMREAKGLNREDVSKQTRIGIDFIVALEEGDYSVLPPDIYIRGFIKSYGEILGADIDELLSRYETEKPKPKARRIFSGLVKEPPPFESPIPKSRTTNKVLVPKKIKLSRNSVIAITAIFIITVVVILVLINRHNDTAPITNVTDVVVSDSLGNIDRRLASSMTIEELSQEIRLKLGDINPAWALGRADSMNLAVVARQKTWILVETDYHRAFKGDIEHGDTMRFTAKNAFFLTMGAPNIMHLEINGFDLGEWPDRNYPMDLDINRGNVLQLLEGAGQISLPRPPRPNIIGSSQPEVEDTNIQQPQIITRRPGTSILNVNTPPPEGPPITE
ncbi:helix-turn-helix domain-containing protein [bacterium]|nr:helix-turn-helix domain-containing protein [bacterium]